MGHPSDWDDVRAALPEFETTAVEIKSANDWQSAVKRLAESIPPGSIIVGYSMGARLALGLAFEDPDRFKGLVFVSGNPGLESETEREARWYSDRRLAERIEAGSLKPFLNDWYQSSVFSGLPDDVRRSEIARKLAQSSKDWPSVLQACSVARQPNYWPRLSELAIPTLVVAGERDEKYRQIADRIREVKNVLVSVVPNSGHIVHREQRTALVDLIREFASKGKGGKGKGGEGLQR